MQANDYIDLFSAAKSRQSPPVVGMIDSGVGGLSVLREIRALLPEVSIHYIGDNAWCPYGAKSDAEIRARTSALTDYLISQGAELIVIACNSATIAAVEALRTQYPIPFIGMEPGVKPAAAKTRSNTIGVLATEVSLRGDKFHHLVSTHAKELRVITRPCPKFVELVEKGTLHGPEVEEAISEYTTDMMEAGADTLILGCSHYPFLRPTLEGFLPPEVEIIDTGAAVARRVEDLKPGSNKDSSVIISTTGSVSTFEELLPILSPELDAQCHSLSMP